MKIKINYNEIYIKNNYNIFEFIFKKSFYRSYLINTKKFMNKYKKINKKDKKYQK